MLGLINKNFITFFLAQFTTNFIDSFNHVALISLMMLYLDKPGAAIALELFFYLLPSLILTPVISTFIDKISRKKLLIGSAIYRFVVAAIFTFIAYSFFKDSVNFYIVYSYSFLIGTGQALFYPAKMAAVPQIVKPELVRSANAFVSGSGSLTLTGGAIAAAVLVEKIGSLYSFAAVSCLYLFTAILLGFVAVKNDDKDFEENDTSANVIRFIKNHRRALDMLALAVILSLLSATFFSGMSSLATDTFGVGVFGLSKLKGMLGFGGALGIVVTLLFSKRVKLHKFLAISFVCLAISLASGGLCTTYHRAVFWLGAIGLFASAMQISVDTVLQKATGKNIRGKIFTVKAMFTTLATLLGTLFVSVGSDIIAPLVMFKYIALGCVILAAFIIMFDKDFRYFLFKSTLGFLFLIFYNYKAEGVENIPKKGKCLLAGNHTSWWDSIILQMATNRKLWFVTGERAFELFLIKKILKYFNVIPIVKKHGRDAIEIVKQKLHEGEAVVIFPEGRLSVDGSLFKFNRGVSVISRESDTPITPFVIVGGFESWKYNRKFPALFKKITVSFCKPIKNINNLDDKKFVQELQRTVDFVKASIEVRTRYKINKKMYENFVDLIRERAYNFANKNALTLKDKDGYWSYSYLQIAQKAKNFANYMMENNMIEKGDRVALLSEARPEWAVALFSCIQSGGILVPLDVKLTISELTSILSDCFPRILCVSAHYVDMAYKIKENVPSIERIFVIDETSETFDNTENIHQVKGDIIKHLARPRSLDETAYIVYTSGTTGSPKGVMVSFSNIYSQLKDFEHILNLNHETSLVSILPLNHLLELNVGLMGMLYLRANVTYTKSLSPKEISKALKDVQATHMIVVPLFAKMLKNSIEKEIRKNPKVEKAFGVMYKSAKFLPLALRRVMFKNIINNFGGKLKFFISGGAPLDNETCEFFERIGMPVYQGYGLTETSPVVATNYPKNSKNGSVGRPLPSTTIRIAENGEILVKGQCVMQGYYHQSEKTAEVIDEDGWFHTGDIGIQDKDGFIFITGRLKNMIVLGGGKKIFPEEVEAVMEKSELFKELCVLSLKIKGGNKAGTEEVGMIAVPADNIQEKSDEEIQSLFEQEVKKLGENLAPYKVPSVVVIHREELPKTSTKKVKRKELVAWYESIDKVDA